MVLFMRPNGLALSRVSKHTPPEQPANMVRDAVEVWKHRRLVEAAFVQNNLKRETNLARNDPLYKLRRFVDTAGNTMVREEASLCGDSWCQVLWKVCDDLFG